MVNRFVKIVIVSLFVLYWNCVNAPETVPPVNNSATLSYYDSTGTLKAKEVVVNFEYDYVTDIEKRRSAGKDSLYVYSAPKIKNFPCFMKVSITALSDNCMIGWLGKNYFMNHKEKMVLSPINGSLKICSSQKVKVAYTTDNENGSDIFDLVSIYECKTNYVIPVIDSIITQYVSISGFETPTVLNLSPTYCINIGGSQTVMARIMPPCNIFSSKPVAIITYTINGNRIFGKVVQ